VGPWPPTLGGPARNSFANRVSDPFNAYKPGVAVVVSGTSKTFAAVPVVIWRRPKPVPGSMRKGEKARPAALVRPGSTVSFSVPAMPSGRWARLGDG